MRHAIFMALLALAASSLSLTAEARWHHHHHHHHHHHRHYRHVRYHRHYRHSSHYLHAHQIGYHHWHHPATIRRQPSPEQGTRTPLTRQTRHGPGAAYAVSGQQPTPLRHGVLTPKSPAVATAPAAPATTGSAKAVASAAPARHAPDWKYPPATLKRVPGGKQHVLAPDTGSFVIIPGYKIVK